MISENLEKRFKLIINEWMKPYLKANHFNFKQRIFSRNHGELILLLDIQRSQWNANEKIEFVINFGVFVPGFWTTYSNRPEPKYPKVPDCCFDKRLKTDSEKEWWIISGVDDSSKDAEIGNQIRSLLEAKVVPFLSCFKSRLDVIRFFEKTTLKESGLSLPRNESIKAAYLAVLYFQLGEMEKSLERIEEAIKNQNPKYDIMQTFLDLRERIRSY